MKPGIIFPCIRLAGGRGDGNEYVILPATFALRRCIGDARPIDLCHRLYPIKAGGLADPLKRIHVIVSNKPSTMFIPDEVKNLPRWNSWQKRFNREDATKKPKKIPYQLNGFAADSNDGSVDQWTTFKLAYDKHLSNGSSGIGFLITMDDPYTGVDIDHCWTTRPGR
jgi:hypothetical protein